jgi:excinuclease ABC subunit A
MRYNEDVLEIKYHGSSIADVLAMPCGEAVELFASEPRIVRVLQTLCDVGLDYVTLGQSAPTLSGGEAQRVKLASELARPGTGKTLYLLDEPTTGLHFDDIAKLMDVIQRLVDLGNTCVVIEHNLDVVKCADWVIDMGPGAGIDGGRIIFEGTPEALAATASTRRTKNSPPISVTAPFVADALRATRGEADEPLKEKDQLGEKDQPEKVTVPDLGELRIDSAGPPEKTLSSKSNGQAKQAKPARTSQKQDSASVWKVLGRKWHSMPKGFDGNAQPDWPIKLPDRLFDQIEKIAGEDCLRMSAANRVDVVGVDGDVKLSIRTRDLDAVKIIASEPIDASEADDLGEAKIAVSHDDKATTLAINRLGQATKPALRRFLKRTLT